MSTDFLPLVSVVIPTYNRRNTIVRAVESALGQTYPELEVIVVDDAGTDGTGELMKRYAKAENFRYVKLPQNAGGGGARNKGIALARGEYVAFLDSDDEWLPEKIEKQMAIAGKYPSAGVVFCQMERIYDGSSTVFPGSIDENGFKNFFTVLIRENKVGTPTAVVKKSLLDRVEGFDVRLPRLQDWDLFLRLSLITEFAMVDEPLCRVYMQEDSISRKPGALLEALHIIEEKFRKQIEALPAGECAAVYSNFGALCANSGIKSAAIRYYKSSLNHKFNVFAFAKYLILITGGTWAYRTLRSIPGR